jgi:hypothetical protein
MNVNVHNIIGCRVQNWPWELVDRWSQSPIKSHSTDQFHKEAAKREMYMFFDQMEPTSSFYNLKLYN